MAPLLHVESGGYSVESAESGNYSAESAESVEMRFFRFILKKMAPLLYVKSGSYSAESAESGNYSAESVESGNYSAESVEMSFLSIYWHRRFMWKVEANRRIHGPDVESGVYSVEMAEN